MPEAHTHLSACCTAQHLFVPAQIRSEYSLCFSSRCFCPPQVLVVSVCPEMTFLELYDKQCSLLSHHSITHGVPIVTHILPCQVSWHFWHRTPCTEKYMQVRQSCAAGSFIARKGLHPPPCECQHCGVAHCAGTRGGQHWVLQVTKGQH